MVKQRNSQPEILVFRGYINILRSGSTSLKKEKKEIMICSKSYINIFVFRKIIYIQIDIKAKIISQRYGYMISFKQ